MTLPATLALLLLLAAAHATAKDTRPPLVFGDERGWAVLSRDGRVLKTMKEVCGKQAESVALSPNLKTTAFTAWSDTAQNQLLYACDSDAREPRLLGEPVGYHAQPSFSEDGEWVYFVHHPRKGGPPGLHEAGANAQVYRVRLDGTSLEALTDTKGCKLAPQQLGATVAYLHATCDGPRSLELLSLEDGARTSSLEDGLVIHYPDLSPDGKAVLLTRKVLFGVELVVVELQRNTTQVVWRLPRGKWDTRAGWSDDGSRIFYQRDGVIWRVSLSPVAREEKVATIGGAK